MNCIIVDDEKLLRESLANTLTSHFPDCKILGKASNTKEARLLLEQHKVDVIFCDIKMPGEDGISFLNSLDTSNYLIVFVTAHDEYALKAIKMKAFDYLLKPIDLEELTQTMGSLELKMHQLQNGFLKKEPLMNDLLNEIKQLNSKSHLKLGINHLNGTSLIELNDILYLEGDGNYTDVFLTKGDKITATKILGDFEKILPETQFLRIHKSSIVNLNEVKEIKRDLGVMVILKNGKELMVSRRNAPFLLDRFKYLAKII